MYTRLSLTLLVAALCCLLGGGLFFYKLLQGFPLMPEEKVSSWHLELSLHVKNAPKNIELRVALPEEGTQLKIIDSYITDNNFGNYTDHDQQGNYVLWSKKNPNRHENLYYRAIIYKVKSAVRRSAHQKETWVLPPLRALSPRLDNKASILALSNIQKKLTARSATDFNIITGLQKMLRQGSDSDLRYLQARLPQSDLVTIGAEILNFMEIPAQIVNGVLLSSAKRNAKIIRWVDAFTDSRKISFAPKRKTMGMPSNILPWWHGNQGMVSTAAKATITKAISVKRHTESALTEAIWSSSQVKAALYNLTIYALPVELQVMMRMLLLIPLGALVCIILKQMVGVKTFGTFMPVLLAMAFRETSFISGMTFFMILIFIGIIFRGILDKMQLLSVPRLGAILTIIVLCVFLLSLFLEGVGMQASGISLFPLVILTMMIERICVTWDEVGGRETLNVTISTLIVSAICYLGIIHPSIEHIFTTFPELLLILASFMLLIGRYNGYKLSEYYRFKAMGS